VKVDIRSVRARLRAPFVSASGALGDRELVLVALEDSGGRVGFGEAAPLADYHGVNAGDVLEALEACRDMLAAAPDDASPGQALVE
jgi:L-alanine-DL-glutamate epimerase-like enolase superfamily enzyme